MVDVVKSIADWKTYWELIGIRSGFQVFQSMSTSEFPQDGRI